jgi:hypothetical protein
MTELQTSQIKNESLPGTFAPETPMVEQVLAPQTDKGQEEGADLDALARMICDRISPHLELELKRNGHHRNTSIFTRGMTTLHRMSPAEQSSSSNAKPDALDLLTTEIEHLLRQRLVLEQERQGRFNGRLPW